MIFFLLKLFRHDHWMHGFLTKIVMLWGLYILTRGRRDLMVVGFTTNYLWNQYLSPLKLWVRTPLRRGVLDTTLYDKVYQWLATGRWFSPGTPVSSTNKTDCQNITEILLKVALNIINQTKSTYILTQKTKPILTIDFETSEQ